MNYFLLIFLLGSTVSGLTTFGKSSQTCNRYEFKCPLSNKCILNSFICDGDKDCPQGEDELNCTTQVECTENEFKCQSGTSCIPSKWKCDDEKDCPDGSDELLCVHEEITCDEKSFQCRTNRECIPSKWVCDGEKDCSDGHDEEVNWLIIILLTYLYILISI